MRQTVHLFIVDVERGEALATWHGPRWLLPIVVAPERARAGLSVPAWVCEHCHVDGRFIGQWLGRAEPSGHSVDWLGIVGARFGDLRACGLDLRRTSLAALKRSPGLLPYQQLAIGKVLSVTALPSTPGPFGTMTWAADVDAWTKTALGEPADTRPDVVVHRASAYDVVLEYRARRRRWYFKGLSSDRTAEPSLAAQLAEFAPRSFPATIAASIRPDRSVWWLMEACGGAPLATCLTNAAAACVAKQYARLQQRAAEAIVSGCLRGLPSLDLSHLMTWATSLLTDTSEAGLAAHTISILGDSCRRASASNVVRSWTSADFDPTNVLIENGDVRFIDLDDCVYGPAPIAAATFARRLKRRGLACDTDVARAYAEAWRPPLDLGERWRAFKLVSSLLECHLDWQHVVLKTQRGEIEGFLEPAQRVLASRLIAAAQSTDQARIS